MGAKQRYFLLLLVDSLIVTFSVFLGYFILAPFCTSVKNTDTLNRDNPSNVLYFDALFYFFKY